MIETLALLLLLQLLGETLVALSGAPVPGPVVGMVLLVLILRWRGAVPERLRRNCTELLAHLSLLFVPAGVGVMVHIDRVSAEWLALLSAIVLGTWLTLGVTAWVMQRMIQWQSARNACGAKNRQKALSP